MTGRIGKYAIACAALALASCTRAPTFDLLGSLFPAWLICFAAAILLTVLVRSLLLRLRIPVFFPVLSYPSMTALFTFALWLVCFRS
ncbi:MAG: YtcA family lipoprotein [Pirellulales bacterium]